MISGSFSGPLLGLSGPVWGFVWAYLGLSGASLAFLSLFGLICAFWPILGLAVLVLGLSEAFLAYWAYLGLSGSLGLRKRDKIHGVLSFLG